MSAVRLGPVIIARYPALLGWILPSTAARSGSSWPVPTRATWMGGRVETRRFSTSVASCTRVPVSARAQSISLMPTLAPAAASRVTS